ncbi:MAG: PPOX class F420-dependent oxidoreductase [Ilumatobacteraceae bacterium]
MVSIATNRSVERDELLDFVRPRHRGVLLTFRRDGWPQSSLVTMGVSSDDHIVVSSYPERAKVFNIRRDPRASMMVMSDEFDGEWVQVDGAAEVIDLPDALDGLVDYFRVISGEHSDWDDYRAAMERQGKCLIRISIDRWGPIAKGGFPPRLAPPA